MRRRRRSDRDGPYGLLHAIDYDYPEEVIRFCATPDADGGFSPNTAQDTDDDKFFVRLHATPDLGRPLRTALFSSPACFLALTACGADPGLLKPNPITLLAGGPGGIRDAGSLHYLLVLLAALGLPVDEKDDQGSTLAERGRNIWEDIGSLASLIKLARLIQGVAAITSGVVRSGDWSRARLGALVSYEGDAIPHAAPTPFGDGLGGGLAVEYVSCDWDGSNLKRGFSVKHFPASGHLDDGHCVSVNAVFVGDMPTFPPPDGHDNFHYERTPRLTWSESVDVTGWERCQFCASPLRPRGQMRPQAKIVEMSEETFALFDLDRIFGPRAFMEIARLCTTGADLLTRTLGGNNPLHVAARRAVRNNDHPDDRVMCLVACGAPVSEPNDDGQTALHLTATRMRFWDCIFLAAAGANLEAPDAAGLTPIDLYRSAPLGDVRPRFSWETAEQALEGAQNLRSRQADLLEQVVRARKLEAARQTARRAEARAEESGVL